MEEKNQPQEVNLNENGLGIIVHLLGIFTGVIGALIMYLIFKDTGTKKLRENIANALNWQISLFIYMLVSGILSIILIGILGILVFSLMNLIFCILGAVEANKGSVYKYPLTINFIKS
jgi:uncharacterized Tic20 family protein